MKTAFVRCALYHTTDAPDGGYPDFLKALANAGEVKAEGQQVWSIQVDDEHDEFDEYAFGVELRGTVKPGDRVSVDEITVRSLPPR